MCAYGNVGIVYIPPSFLREFVVAGESERGENEESTRSSWTMETPSKTTGTEKGRRTPHPTPRTTSLNEHLNTEYITVGDDDTSASAQLTRAITSCVGRLVTPRSLLVVLRILKAVTFCFLILTICADLMYIVFLEVTGHQEVKELAGGRRDTILRVYGLFLAVVAICIELDYAAVVKSFYGFKGFIPRSLLLFFVSVITGAHPLHAKEANYNNNNGGGNGDDDNDDYYDETAFIESQIPHSAINFQMVTSFIL